ncbi:MAG: hypothetical protein HOQ47_05265 [Streptomyces sp.]|nr:hypothetical protein [Streptomyces sp.]
MHVWSELWPNLAANVLWVPVAWAYHRVAIVPRFRALREHQATLHRQHEELLLQHVLGSETANKEGAAS